jgi:hypothetical protein
MADRNELEVRVGRVEEKLDALTQSVDAAFVEQREYTELAFGRLAAEMRIGFGQVDARFNRLERKLDQFIDTQSRGNALD